MPIDIYQSNSNQSINGSTQTNATTDICIHINYIPLYTNQRKAQKAHEASKRASERGEPSTMKIEDEDPYCSRFLFFSPFLYSSSSFFFHLANVSGKWRNLSDTYPTSGSVS